MSKPPSTSATSDGGSSVKTATIQPSDIPMLVEAMMETVFRMVHHGPPHDGGGHKPQKSRHENLTKAIENITPVALDIVIQSISEEQGSPYDPTVEMIEGLKPYIALWLRNKMSLQ